MTRSPDWLLREMTRLGRDVVLKLMDKNTDEYRICETLLQKNRDADNAEFTDVLPPVAILDSPHGWSVAITPR